MESVENLIQKLSEKEVLPHRVVNEDFEKQSRLEPVNKDRMSRRKKREEARKRREATAGLKWFDLPKQEINEEDKLNLEVLQMRSAIDPKRFYKRKAINKDLPDYYQVGTVVEHPADFYSQRIPKRQRKTNLVDELLADVDFKRTARKRYQKIKYSKQNK